VIGLFHKNQSEFEKRRPIRGRYTGLGEEKDKTIGNPAQILSYAENTMTQHE
jgi:hypothetical protein